MLRDMSGILAVFGATFLVSLSGALMPGPLFTYTVRESLRRGFIVGPAVAAGHVVVELGLVVALGLGLSRFLEHDSAARALIALLGGLFLLWMGWGMVRGGEGELPQVGGPDQAPVGGPGFAPSRTEAVTLLAPAGVLISVSNPYWSLWWATIGMGLLSKGLDYGAAGAVSFFTAHALSDILWLSLVAFLLASGRRLLGGRAYRLIVLGCGIGLLFLGGGFVLSGARYFT